jgi:hypothetical protein
VKEIPFFTFNSITKETQIKELFQDSCDPQTYKNLLKNIISTADRPESSDLVTKRLSIMQVMNFAQMILYKVLPCPDANCPNRPREIATHNQYKDYEYQCPFYHHDRDHRRIVITPKIGEEFVYKANYYEEGKRSSDKDKYSQNYFESVFHPLYYKMFKCKREYCNFSQLCPFYHSEEEKKTWDKTFSNYIRKDRISYVKDKQKYFEKDEAKKNKSLNSSTTTTTTTANPTPEEKTNPLITKTERVKRGSNVKTTTTVKGNCRIEETESRPMQSKKWEDWKKDSESISPKSTASKDSKESSSTGKSKAPSTIKSQ